MHPLSPEKPTPWSLIGAIALMAALSGLFIWFYLGDGRTPGKLDMPLPAHSGGAAPADNHPQQIAGMVERLAKRLESEPDNAHGWAMLARSYAALGRFEDAVQAFEKAARLDANNDALLTDYADALAMVQGKRLEGKPEALARQALGLNPDNIKALYLVGTAAFNRNELKEAKKYWNLALQKAPADSEWVAPLRASLTELERHPILEGKPLPARR